MRERACEAEVHHVNCPCVNCTRLNCNRCFKTNIDHFTPKCVIKKQKIKFKNQKDNLQYLSVECHRMKDRSTPSRKRNAVFRTLDALREWRNRNDLVLK